MTGPQPTFDTATVWVALSNQVEDLDVGVASTRAGALRWLVARIDPAEWADYARLNPLGGDPLPVDPTVMDPQEVLRQWYGDLTADSSDAHSIWGAGQDQFCEVRAQQVIP